MAAYRRMETGFSRRAALVAGSVASVAAAAAVSNSRTQLAIAKSRRVSVRQFGADGKGEREDTAAFQRACDTVAASGGIVDVPSGLYLVDRVVIRGRGITVLLADDAIIRKFGNAGLSSRGTFEVVGILDAEFELRGGTIDLNGEGPQGIGTPGRITNRYAPLTVKTVTGIAGPPNAALYALRSSGLRVRNCMIRNSGENGILFRNCGDTLVEDCRFDNLANWAIEYSIVSGEGDGGTTPRPRIGECTVRRCAFTNIDDLALGTGNGVGIGGGGGSAMGAFAGFTISDCTFFQCNRDIHFEFERGSHITDLRITRIRSSEARQGSLGLVSVKGATVENYEILNPGSAPAALLIAERPEVYGVVLSSGFRDIVLRNVSIRDTRSGKLLRTQGVSAMRGTTAVRTTAPQFEPEDVGAWIGIAEANPSGTPFIGKVVEVLSPREVAVSHPIGRTVRDGVLVLGGVTRNGIILTSGEDVQFENVLVEAGAAADHPSRAEAAAVRLFRVGGRIEFSGTTLRAPSARGAEKEIAVRSIDSTAVIVGLPNTAISGYAQRLKVSR